MALEIKRKAEGTLHPTLEMIERMEEKLQERFADVATKEGVSAEVARAMDPMAAEFQELKERCKQLEDKYRGAGDKFFEGSNKNETDGIRSLGQVITAARRFSRDGVLPEGLTRAQSEGTDTAGGVFVPTLTYDKVMAIFTEKSLMRKLCTVIPMSSDKLVLPIRTAIPTAEWPGEATAATDVSITLKAASSSTLDSDTMTVLDKVSRELTEDALVAVEAFMANTLAEAVAKEENKQLLMGTGSPFTGIIATGSVPSVQMATAGHRFANVTFDQIWQTEFAIDGDIIGEGGTIASVCRKEFFQYAYSLKDSNGYPIWANGWAGFPHDVTGRPSAPASRPQNLGGVPTYLTKVMDADAANKVAMVHGDFSKAIMGDRRQLLVEWDDSIFFKERQRACLLSERIAFLVAFPTAFALLKTAAT